MTDDLAAAPDAPAGRHTARGTRRLRIAGLAASVLVVVAAGFVVPMPYVATGPGSATAIDDLLEVGGPTTELTGDLDLLTVSVDQPGLFGTAWAWWDDAVELDERGVVIPPDLDNAAYFAAQRETFRNAFRLAAAVGLRAAGHEVTVRTAPQVTDVAPGAPAEGVLQPGDVIEAVGGVPLASADDLIAQVRGVDDGDVVHLTIEREEEVRDVEVVAGEVAGLPRPGLGITVLTVGTDVDLPVEVALVDQRGIGGPSAGLMTALTVYDLVAEEDLVRGRRVVGTGEIAADGTVGRVGSIRQKAITAARLGADIMLLPASQAAEARAAVDGPMQIVGVTTFDDALAALRR